MDSGILCNSSRCTMESTRRAASPPGTAAPRPSTCQATTEAVNTGEHHRDGAAVHGGPLLQASRIIETPTAPGASHVILPTMRLLSATALHEDTLTRFTSPYLHTEMDTCRLFTFSFIFLLNLRLFVTKKCYFCKPLLKEPETQECHYQELLHCTCCVLDNKEVELDLAPFIPSWSVHDALSENISVPSSCACGEIAPPILLLVQPRSSP